ncbi:hypothetical protein [Thiolinea disciformis]|uniref:hypothetical protein n=1 Tax=Thiolinea disciformis TaxID=125614 RepID=UPI00035C2D5E|nr:hypothetical protein [Thiolinea disciformis]
MNPQHDPLDDLLAQTLMKPPATFTQTVMQRITYLPQPVKKTGQYLQWLALLGAVALGLEQVLGFMFGIWLVSSAG